MSNSDPIGDAASLPWWLRWRRELIIGAVTLGGLIGVLLTVFGGEFQRRLVFDTWQQTAPREITTDDVVVVMIDNASVNAVGEWPWQRYWVARLFGEVSEAKPAAIGIDIYFTQPDAMRPAEFISLYSDEELDPETKSRILPLASWDDSLLSIVGNRDAPTIAARAGRKFPEKATTTPSYTPADEVFYSGIEGAPPSGTIRATHVLTSFPELDGAAFTQGLVNGAPDSDGVVRRVPLSIVAGSTVAPGFAVEIAKVSQNLETLRWDAGSLIFGDARIPADDAGNMRFKMGKYPTSEVIPALNLIEGFVDEERLAGKIVIIGVGATGTGDVVATPIGSEVLGPLVQAQAVDAILNGEWLDRPTWIMALEFALAALLFAMLLGAGLTSRNWLIFPAVAVAIAMPFVSLLAYVQANLLLDPLRPILIGLFSAIGLLLVRYGLTLAELVQQRINAAKQQQENEDAQKIQMSMVPGAATLARLDKRTEIGAVLKPAKSVGGDFYDAVKINDDQLLFLVGDVSGKGMPAALFMALSKTLAKSNLARAGDGLDLAVASFNQELLDQEEQEMDLTMLVGVIDCSTGATQLINAGHENPLIVHSDGNVENIEMMGGPRLCALDFPYPIEAATLSKGDTLIIITDGATEAANRNGEQFGLEGVIASLKAKGSDSATDQAEYLASEVRSFEKHNDPTDDLTIFALRFVGA